MNSEDLLQQAIQAARIGDSQRAKNLFLRVTKLEPDHLVAWAWLIDIQEELDDQITACQKAILLSPDNLKLQKKLNELLAQRRGMKPEKTSESSENPRSGAAKNTAVRQNNPRASQEHFAHFQDNPLDLAAKYEEEGKYDEAIATYQKAAMQIRYGPEFDQIFKNIERLEKHKASGVVYVRPTQSIARLTFGPPLLFFLLIVVHNRMNPFAFTPDLWLGAILTLAGGYLLAIANVRSRHPIWKKMFDDPGAGGSPLARVTLSLAGWLLIFVSFGYLFQISFERLPLVATNTFLP